jgi:ubiquinone/menaquinone biosynthesis C-methylase UbiE
MASEASWEREAERWVLWARTPGHDAFWQYRDEFFEAMVPPPGRQTLEVGCGEGRVLRDLAARGHRVVGVDSSPTLLGYARDESQTGRFALADGAALPFRGSSFDIVVAFNSLMDVDDMPGAVREASRVLAGGGCLCACVTHPVSDSGAFVSAEPDAAFVIEGSYFGRRRFEATVERAGLKMTFRGWSYALEDYARALEEASLRLELVREPRPAEVTPQYERWTRIPMFLFFRARKA